MPYNAQITRSQPSCFLFLIDQSSSMAQPFGAGEERTITKAEGVAAALNDLLRNLVITCSKSEGVRNYFEIGVFGYGAAVGPAFGGLLSGHELVSMRELAEYPVRIVERAQPVDDGTGNIVSQRVRYPVWVEPVAAGNTPMCAAMYQAWRTLSAWLQRNPTCFPPIVVHITDGEATDGDPAPAMWRLTSLSSLDGNVLLVNVHLSSNRNATPTSFPDSPAGLPDDFSRMLFENASVLTPHMRAIAWEQGIYPSEAARAFVLNADSTLVVTALEIGTRPGNLW